MTRLLNAKKRLSSIGLEIDAHEFRAVQLMQSSQGINTVAWAIFPRHEGHVSDEMAELPTSEELHWGSDILSRRGFIGNAVSITPSHSESSSHILELPPASSGAPIKQLARMEVARSRKCAPDDFELGYWALPAKGRTHETLAVAFPRTTIDQTIERFESAGFVPVGMDLMELAIHRGTHTPDGEVENEINASLHIGWESSLAVLTLGNTVIYVRRVKNGVCRIWNLLVDRYQLSPRGASMLLNDTEHADQTDAFPKLQRAVWLGLAGELVQELDVAIAYVSHTFRMAPLGTIRLSGYGAGNQTLIKQIDLVLGIPVVDAPYHALTKELARQRMYRPWRGDSW